MNTKLIIESIKELEMLLALDYFIDIFEIDIPANELPIRVITPLCLIKHAKTFEEAEVALNNFVEGLNKHKNENFTK